MLIPPSAHLKIERLPLQECELGMKTEALGAKLTFCYKLLSKFRANPENKICPLSNPLKSRDPIYDNTPKTQAHTRFTKTVPKSRVFFLFSRCLLLRRMQTHFELFILIQCIILIQETRVSLSTFLHSRVLRKGCIATNPENC